jgi:hypothetical protein
VLLAEQVREQHDELSGDRDGGDAGTRRALIRSPKALSGLG